VSRAFEETSTADSPRTWTHYCPQPRGPPSTLRIVNGIARAGKAEGSVSPQGVLVMRDFWSHYDGQIDAQGTARARSTSGCSYQLVWQKFPTNEDGRRERRRRETTNAALPPPTMPFDGDYVGVLRESSCQANRVPGALIIRNSIVTGGGWQGNVNPQGVLVIRNERATQVEGQIDGQGVIRGQGRNAAGCAISWIWRKQSQ
jgi:hypothetical protein